MKKVVANTEALKKFREDFKFSVTFVSEKLGYKTPSAYWLIENGERKMGIDTLFRLSKLYNINMSDLVKEIDD